MKINEIKAGKIIELVVKVDSISEPRYLWRCDECKKNNVQKPYGLGNITECPVCKSQISETPNQGLSVQKLATAMVSDDTGEIEFDLYAAELGRIGMGDKIRLLNGFAKEINTKEGQKIIISKGNYGQIQILDNEAAKEATKKN
jgi:hypothetical protein